MCRIKNAISITNKTNILRSRSKAPPFVIVTNMEMSKLRETRLCWNLRSIQTEPSDRYGAPYRLTHVILFFMHANRQFDPGARTTLLVIVNVWPVREPRDLQLHAKTIGAVKHVNGLRNAYCRSIDLYCVEQEGVFSRLSREISSGTKNAYKPTESSSSRQRVAISINKNSRGTLSF